MERVEVAEAAAAVEVVMARLVEVELVAEVVEPEPEQVDYYH